MVEAWGGAFKSGCTYHNTQWLYRGVGTNLRGEGGLMGKKWGDHKWEARPCCRIATLMSNVLKNPVCPRLHTIEIIEIYIYHWRRKRGGGEPRGHVPPPRFCLGGGQWYVCAPPPPPPPRFTPHFHFSLELYVDIKLTNNYLAFFIYQLIILWTISIN